MTSLAWISGGPAAGGGAAARRVICFDDATGLVRWTYPRDGALRGDVPAWQRTIAREPPVRDVVEPRKRREALQAEDPLE